MSTTSVHDDWLSLIEISGPFLAVPVLKEAFPQGLEELDGTKRKRLRQAYEEWREALELEDAQFAELHMAWIDEVLSRGLELDEDGKCDVLKRADWCAANLKASLPEHGVTLSPDLAVIDEQRAHKPLLLIQTYAQDVDLDATLKQDGWAVTPSDRMVQLCRSLGCRLGLMTNGERWMLVDAPVGAVTTFASWYARIWSQEPITLQAFVHLLGIRRFFVDESEQLPALFDRSLKFQDEVTDALGEQVRRAVEVLIQTLDKADQDRNRELLHDVKEPELYEAALTVMMRLVFLLSAEERGLLLMGDERYEANYALSTLRMQLRKESEEILERRWDAWSRLLAIFRAVFGGIEHENLRLPALGGSLFDPDRFPFLEGRVKGSNWRSDAAKPLPIDNRTVLLLLEAIQQFQGRTLSYRALDVEQIGYVYEGLLERTVKRTDEVTLELDATKSAKTPWVKLAELDSARLDGAARLAELLQERSGSFASRVRNDLAKPVDDTLADRLLTACQGDTKLRDRVKPYAHLLRTDPWGYPLVYPADAFIVTTGSDRRETGTHYTPKSLTEGIIAETLTPVAYVGPAEGTPREQWALKSPAELLDLKICDPAMGSGAFLVQACRWLADRLVEAWSQVEAFGKTVSVDGEVLDAGAAKEPLPRDSEARTVIARRLIAERCLYGVDLNPLAVELAKLSIWLVTLAKGRPFGFLDHNLRCGDSLLGIHRLDQLTELSMTPSGKGQKRLFGQNIEKAVVEAIELRQRLREMPIRDIHDVEAMAQLDVEARLKLSVPARIADAFVCEMFVVGTSPSVMESALSSLAIRSEQAVGGDLIAITDLIARAKSILSVDLPATKSSRRPFHWPLEFPEVFSRLHSGFDALVGNPPFLGGQRITDAFGMSYREFLVNFIVDGARGSADFCAYFIARYFSLSNQESITGVIGTKTISQGDTREVGLKRLTENGAKIVGCKVGMEWPGAASVVISIVWLRKGNWRGTLYTSQLEPTQQTTVAEWSNVELKANFEIAYIGSQLSGEGFKLSSLEAQEYIRKQNDCERVIFPILRGEDVTNEINQAATQYVINFDNLSEREAEFYAPCFRHVKERVFPERQKVKRESRRQRWWQYAERSARLYDSIASLEEVIVHPFTAKYLCPSIVSARQVFSAPMVVFTTGSRSLFSILQSNIHGAWVASNSSTMGATQRYTPSDCLRTFPLPLQWVDSQKLILHGEQYLKLRNEIMQSESCGITSLYNSFHNPKVHSSSLAALRALHQEIDRLVVSLYGWDDINLEHDFYESPTATGNDRFRFAISEAARKDVICRLTQLNRQRHEEELALSSKGNTKVQASPKSGRRGEGSSAPTSGDMFDGDDA